MRCFDFKLCSVLSLYSQFGKLFLENGNGIFLITWTWKDFLGNDFFPALRAWNVKIMQMVSPFQGCKQNNPGPAVIAQPLHFFPASLNIISMLFPRAC